MKHTFVLALVTLVEFRGAVAGQSSLAIKDEVAIIQKRHDSPVAHWTSQPGSSPYVKVYENVQRYDEQKHDDIERSSGPLYSVHNTAREPLFVWPEITFTASSNPRDHGFYPELAGRMHGSKIRVEPNEILSWGGIPEPPQRAAGGEKYSSAIRMFWKCDEWGLNCASDLGSASKIEFSVEPQGKKNMIGINDSNVDGVNMNYLILNPPGSTCPRLGCKTTQETIRNTCPSQNLREIKGKFSCVSDCRRTNSPEHCCTGSCTPSFHWAKEICPSAFHYPEDYKNTYHVCDPRGEVFVQVYGN